jgi:hypothetical protein
MIEDTDMERKRKINILVLLLNVIDIREIEKICQYDLVITQFALYLYSSSNNISRLLIHVYHFLLLSKKKICFVKANNFKWKKQSVSHTSTQLT